MEPRTYQQSTSEIRSVRIQVTGDFTPQDVAQLIYDNNLHEYTFTNGGIGCRYYSIVIASFLSSKRWLPECTASSGHPNAPVAITAAQRQLQLQGFWDGTLSIQEAQRECNFLLAQSAQIMQDHPISKAEGLQLAMQRQEVEEEDDDDEEEEEEQDDDDDDVDDD
ncbi:hypothetical protein LTR09_003602 [Extremus antarcticus]|uniref:DUF7770 domain-containing protein n=1 Tax=Extremus antarcticus TaxID=702011 RepID=A0AAJ0DK71_9PEZI|nr:hypothetical protein LTR09_003602 [Extremus antarcticus]